MGSSVVVGLTEEREKKVKENMEERMKAEGMKSVSRLIIFSHEPLSTPGIVPAIRCLLDVVPPDMVNSRYIWLWETLRATFVMHAGCPFRSRSSIEHRLCAQKLFGRHARAD